MKHLLLSLSLLFVLNAQADIEHVENTSSRPSEEEIHKNRSCFKELRVLGCGDPSEDLKHFRACLSNVYEGLNQNCKELMTELYGR